MRFTDEDHPFLLGEAGAESSRHVLFALSFLKTDQWDGVVGHELLNRCNKRPRDRFDLSR